MARHALAACIPHDAIKQTRSFCLWLSHTSRAVCFWLKCPHLLAVVYTLLQLECESCQAEVTYAVARCCECQLLSTHHSTCCSDLGDSGCGVLQRYQPEPIAVKTKRSKASRPRRRSCGFHKRGGRAIAVNRAQPAAMLSLMTALALAMYTSNASSHICSKRSQIWFPAGFC